MITTAVVIFVISIVCWRLLTMPSFGRLPEGARLQRIQSLPNYANGQLNNLSPTPMKPEDVTYRRLILSFFFGNHPRRKPQQALPHQIPDYTPDIHPKLTWFGHSSYLLQLIGVNILVDPVFGSTPSPFTLLGSKNFKGTGFAKAEDMPNIDVILLTHDHYDHLCHKTIVRLKRHNPRFIVSLGVGAHLERWGIPPENITELSWGQETTFRDISFRSVTARHFSGRKFKRNRCLWAAFIVKTHSHNLFLGGDSGYDKHFKEIGEQYGPFDLALLECGQYNTMWPFIHMFPVQTVQAAKDLNAKVLMPVHWGKFTLALHPWDEPIEEAVKHAEIMDMPLATPRLGETFIIAGNYPAEKWWRGY